METLDVCVLRGLTGLDMHQLDLPFDAPGQEMTTGQFGAVWCYGSEFTSLRMLGWTERREIIKAHIQPGRPKQSLWPR